MTVDITTNRGILARGVKLADTSNLDELPRM